MQLPLPPLDKARVLVIGDIMLDRYWHGAASRISPEAPVPVVKIGQIEDRLGGAANVALNLSRMGAKVILLGQIGTDDHAKSLKALLKKEGIEYALVETPLCPTITKLRVLSQDQQLIRLDFEETVCVDEISLFRQYAEALESVDVVILSDYAKGLLNNATQFIQLASSKGKKVLVDPKHPTLDIYQGAHIITPNKKEFEAIVGPCPTVDILETKALALVKEANLDALLITRGAEGMSLVTKSHQIEHIPAIAREVYDVTGAGDTVIALLAAAIAVGTDYVTAAKIANVGAAAVVAKVGTATVSMAELRQGWHGNGYKVYGIDDLSSLVTLVNSCKEKGEKVVFTNGCFDILHAGHVSYLEEAKALGHKLIVAVNSDASIKRLKGISRPINTLNLRLKVLAGLGAVDYLIPFDTDTPLELIEALLPDYLVKGGDYIPNDIVGAAAVRANGGEVKVLPFVDNCSTTQLIDSIRQV